MKKVGIRMKPKISVIVPIYNCEKYLDRLINSVLKQTYKNFELILINDGSTDSSKEKIEKYQDERIIVINKENGGVSETRNRGLKEATGELICFLDSDDYISKRYFATIIKYFEEYPKLELLNFGFYSETENNNLEQISIDKISYKEKFYENKEELKKDFVALWDNTMLYNIWNKVYLASLIKENKIEFSKDNWGEDILFNRIYLRCIKNLYNSKEAFYHYVREREGALTKNFKDNLFETRKQEYYEFNAYFKIWDIKKEDYIEFSSRRFIERTLGCIENIYCKDMKFKERYKEVSNIVKDDLTRETIKIAKPRSKKTKIALIPIKLKSVILTMLMGKLFHYIKVSHPSTFNKLKNRR